jgi:hypothetical protein
VVSFTARSLYTRGKSTPPLQYPYDTRLGLSGCGGKDKKWQKAVPYMKLSKPVTRLRAGRLAFDSRR